MADDAPGADLPRLVEAVRANLLGGDAVYTSAEVAEQAGISLDEARALWRALGFATVEDGQRVFTEADVVALRNVEELRRVGDIDDELMQSMTRILGQTFARLASWQGQLVTEIIAKSPELLADPDGQPALDLMDRLKPVVTDLHSYVWSRQLAAYFARIVANATTEPGSQTAMAVGFADMAEFTAFTRRSSEAELRDVLGRFESVATEVVGAHRGQVVKTIGDEVLFIAHSPGEAAEIALALLEAAEADASLPPFRAGVAYGPVVTRLGDVFGQTVNIASRLTSLARTGSVLIDEGLAGRLDGDARYSLRTLRPASVRGYSHLKSWRLRRA
ncbi:MAG TPA: adenylate/guanylate cyclase domain-containing protein [Jatrophihabitans sp.]|jgi:adenylate cyclase|uniref:adenylate/guanylate cyclase domain-containing protein n=1 Tax=Jatrophihabitans sp. TaxID=1932789 RepID=UPI002DF80DE7|nr:adenylate/guanylate cyclase domain-containing protein [Jatrophihabitans sp.]